MNVTYRKEMQRKIDAEINKGAPIESITLHAGQFAQFCNDIDVPIKGNPFNLFRKDSLPDHVHYRGVLIKLNRSHYK